MYRSSATTVALLRKRFVAAFSAPTGDSVRLVFRREEASNPEGMSFVVVKLIGRNYAVRTVKHWFGNFDRTVQQWRTTVPHEPSDQEFEVACSAIEYAISELRRVIT